MVYSSEEVTSALSTPNRISQKSFVSTFDTPLSLSTPMTDINDIPPQC